LWSIGENRAEISDSFGNDDRFRRRFRRRWDGSGGRSFRRPKRRTKGRGGSDSSSGDDTAFRSDNWRRGSVVLSFFDQLVSSASGQLTLALTLGLLVLTHHQSCCYQEQRLIYILKIEKYN
jgi:hypothetical protein